MVSIIELSNKTSIDSSLYSFHTLEGGVCATNPTFFLLSNRTNLMIILQMQQCLNWSFWYRQKIPSSLFNYKLNTLTIKKASKVSHREGSFKEDYDYDLINSWRGLTITVKIETLSFNHLGALKLNRLDIDTQKY